MEHGQNPVIDRWVTENNKEVKHIRMFSAAHRGGAIVTLSSHSGGSIYLFIIYCSAGMYVVCGHCKHALREPAQVPGRSRKNT